MIKSVEQKRNDFFACLISKIADPENVIACALEANGKPIRFIGEYRYVHLKEDGEPVRLVEIFREEKAVEILYLTRHDDVTMVGQRGLECLAESEKTELARFVYEKVNGVNVPKGKSLFEVIKEGLMSILIGDIVSASAIPFGTMVRKYPMEDVGEWVEDYDSQCYMEDCREAYSKNCLVESVGEDEADEILLAAHAN